LSKVRIQVDSPGNAEIAIDAILVTPDPFQPGGVVPPDPMNFQMIPTKQQSRGRKGRGSGGP